jgi:hypothetical protein
MAIKTSAVMLLAVLCSVATAEAQTPALKKSGSFTFDVQATAAEQFRYAAAIRAEGTDLSLQHEAVLRSVAALEVIPKRWPDERALSLRAYTEILFRLRGAFLHQNAIAYADKAVAYAGNAPERLIFLAAKGRSLMWLGRAKEAEEAFRAATGPDFARLSDFDQSGILLDAAYFEERRGEPRAAARLMRQRAGHVGAVARAEAYRKALDLSLTAKDHGSARADLAALVQAASDARKAALSADEQQVLGRLEAAIAEYRKKLGS